VATLEEIEVRFGRETELRRVEMQSLVWLVDLARRAGAKRLVINGSCVTDRPEPNDVDCALLVGPELLLNPQAEKELREGLPFIARQLVTEDDFRILSERFFATDRRAAQKG